jgi:hypothetical protein
MCMIARYVLSSWLVYGHTQDYETASTLWTALSIVRPWYAIRCLGRKRRFLRPMQEKPGVRFRPMAGVSQFRQAISCTTYCGNAWTHRER